MISPSVSRRRIDRNSLGWKAINMHSIVTKRVALLLLFAPLILLGGIGFVFLASPSHSRSNSPWLTVASTSQIPANGRPVFLPVRAPRYDAWTQLTDEVIAHVFVRRDLVTNEIKVISSVHGPLSVPVDYDPQTGCFISRCFDIRFDINGAEIHNDGKNSSNEEGMHPIDFMTVDNVLFIRNKQS